MQYLIDLIIRKLSAPKALKSVYALQIYGIGLLRSEPPLHPSLMDSSSSAVFAAGKMKMVQAMLIPFHKSPAFAKVSEKRYGKSVMIKSEKNYFLFQFKW
ncbi:hypothetical protein CEN49_14185 [Fischerella thermalis CCMEE 5273]|nr:hypothetical protein CEN49_14185 [Fischerella thermalis CCMEE 5273]